MVCIQAETARKPDKKTKTDPSNSLCGTVVTAAKTLAMSTNLWSWAQDTSRALLGMGNTRTSSLPALKLLRMASSAREAGTSSGNTGNLVLEASAGLHGAWWRDWEVLLGGAWGLENLLLDWDVLLGLDVGLSLLVGMVGEQDAWLEGGSGDWAAKSAWDGLIELGGNRVSEFGIGFSLLVGAGEILVNLLAAAVK